MGVCRSGSFSATSPSTLLFSARLWLLSSLSVDSFACRGVTWSLSAGRPRARKREGTPAPPNPNHVIWPDRVNSRWTTTLFWVSLQSVLVRLALPPSRAAVVQPVPVPGAGAGPPAAPRSISGRRVRGCHLVHSAGALGPALADSGSSRASACVCHSLACQADGTTGASARETLRPSQTRLVFHQDGANRNRQLTLRVGPVQMCSRCQTSSSTTTFLQTTPPQSAPSPTRRPTLVPLPRHSPLGPR